MKEDRNVSKVHSNGIFLIIAKFCCACENMCKDLEASMNVMISRSKIQNVFSLQTVVCLLVCLVQQCQVGERTVHIPFFLPLLSEPSPLPLLLFLALFLRASWKSQNIKVRWAVSPPRTVRNNLKIAETGCEKCKKRQYLMLFICCHADKISHLDFPGTF